jgi:cystathionine beta-lyase
MSLSPTFFETPIERRGSDSLKWGLYGDRDILPLWVADMDFLSAPAITEALSRRAAHGVYGYAKDSQAAVAALIDYHREHYGFAIDRTWVVPVPGLVCGLNILCRAVGEPGDSVATTVPVYPPFLEAPALSGRTLVTAPMTLDAQGRPVFDLDALDAAMTPATRLFILCNPHNPLGRAWTSAELRDLLAFCRARGVTVCSDEIHGGLVLDAPYAYTPAACAAPEFADTLVTLLAPSKTYNLPGLSCAFAVIPDPDLRQRFRTAMAGIVPHVNLFGWVAAEAAYRLAEPWRLALLDTLRKNRDTVEAAARAWGVAMPHVEATYLAWFDLRPWLDRMSGLSPAKYFLAHGVGLMDGAPFGAPGFARLNFATRSGLLATALDRISRSGLFPASTGETFFAPTGGAL